MGAVPGMVERKEGGKMKEPVPKMCITCQHYELYHCTLNDGYIGYLYCSELTKCKAWRLHENYKKGGKWYDSRPERKQKEVMT